MSFVGTRVTEVASSARLHPIVYAPTLTLLAPLLHPSKRLRLQCLLLLVMLVTALLYLGTRPYIAVAFAYLPWDKLLHATVYGGFAALGWVAMGGRSQVGAVLLACVIGLMDEAMQHYTPGRSSDFNDIVADLIGALLIVLILKTLQSQHERQLSRRRSAPVAVEPSADTSADGHSKSAPGVSGGYR